MNNFVFLLLLAVMMLVLLIGVLFVDIRLITKRFRRSREQLYDRLDLLRHLVGAGSGYLFIADSAGNIIDIHPDIQLLNGFTPEVLYSEKLTVLLNNDTPQTIEQFWKVLQTKQLPYHLQIEGVWKDGQKFSCPVEVKPMISHKTIVGYVVRRLIDAEVVKTDQSSLSANHTQELEQSRAKEQVIVESIGDGVMVTDARAKIVMMNKAAKEIIGATEAHLNESAFEVLSLEDEHNALLLPQWHPLHEALQSERRVMSRTYHIVRDDFSRVSLALTASPVIVDDEVVGGVVVFRDITKERDVDRAKTEFVSLASHQLRTPLTTISWYTELIMGTDSGNLTQEQKEYLEVIYEGNRRMIDLVNALLNVSRLELGTFIIEPESTNMTKLVQSVLDDVKPAVQEKKHSIEFISESEIEDIPVDPRLMRMIIQNLVTNAVKYTPDGGKIEVRLQKHYPDFLLKITDNGYGIPAGQQDRIFTKLFRAENVQTKTAEGTGLGLYIAKSILDESGGRIWFESEENKGTTFYVTIPLTGMNAKSGTKSLS